MQIKLKYYPQHTNFSCGPTSLRMIFEHLAVHYSEEKLIKLCQAVPKFGTSHEHLIAEVHKEKLHCREMHHATLEDLKRFLKSGYPILVNYLNPKTNNGHYAVVCGYQGKSLILADPTNGADFTIDDDEFLQHWHNKKHTSQGWLLLVSKEKLNLDDNAAA